MNFIHIKTIILWSMSLCTFWLHDEVGSKGAEGMSLVERLSGRRLATLWDSLYLLYLILGDYLKIMVLFIPTTPPFQKSVQ